VAQTNVINAIRETLTGDRVAINVATDVGSGVTREVLTGDRVGQDWYSDVLSVGRDVLTGDRLGKNTYADVASVIRETLIKEPPLRAMHASREVLLSMQNESLSVQRLVKSYRQTAIQKRPPMALPSTVQSARDVATYRENVVMSAVRPWARSTDFAATLRMQVISRRIAPAAPTVKSSNYIGNYRELVVQSRGIAYVSVSEIRVTGQRQQVVQHRNTLVPNQVRTAITTATLVQQFIASRATQVVVITTEVDAFTLVEQTVQATGRPAPHSPIDNAYLVEMVVQRRSVVPPNSGENAMQLVQQTVRLRDIYAPHGDDLVAGLVQQTVTPRDVVTNRSTTRVAASVELAVVHRETYAPAYAQGRHARTLDELVVQQRLDSTGARRSPLYAMQLSLRFVLGRTTPKPWDVIDPSIGRHAATLTMLSLLHRDTQPPGKISKESRYVFNLVEQVVAGDTFPAPDLPPPVIPETDAYQVAEEVVLRDSDWGPVSAVSAIQVAGQAVVGDNQGWIDATVPTSEIRTFEVFGAAIVGEHFPDPAKGQSDAEVAGLVEAVALGDAGFPNPMIPQSAVQARSVAELVAVGDAQFPNPMIPASAVQSSLVGAAVAVRDPSLQGNFGMSEISVSSVLEFALIRDPTLVGIPRRTGPRPIVTVSMS
jgi:hypothetical protein